MIGAVVRYARRLSLAIWIGQMVFFGAIFAPRVFRVLERPVAGNLQAHLFPPYFAMGLVGDFLRQSEGGLFLTKLPQFVCQL
ncbi:DUF4149 domain-containing protein [bacterium]|nr:DUF4149 domain-containing protein [bacterium]